MARTLSTWRVGAVSVAIPMPTRRAVIPKSWKSGDCRGGIAIPIDDTIVGWFEKRRQEHGKNPALPLRARRVKGPLTRGRGAPASRLPGPAEWEQDAVSKGASSRDRGTEDGVLEAGGC